MMWTTPKGERVHGFLRENEIIRLDDASCDPRASMRIERICKHGVGHPIGATGKWMDWMGVHGCCGCCSLAEFWLPLVKSGEFYVRQEKNGKDTKVRSTQSEVNQDLDKDKTR